MAGMTLISDARREAARQSNGQFGEHEHTAPELTLPATEHADGRSQRLADDRRVILTALATLDGNTDEFDEDALDTLLAEHFGDQPHLVHAADIRTIRARVLAGFAEHDRARAALQEARRQGDTPAEDSEVVKAFYAAGRQMLANYEERSRANRVLNALSFNNGIEMKREAMALRDAGDSTA